MFCTFISIKSYNTGFNL